MKKNKLLSLLSRPSPSKGALLTFLAAKFGYDYADKGLCVGLTKLFNYCISESLNNLHKKENDPHTFGWFKKHMDSIQDYSSAEDLPREVKKSIKPFVRDIVAFAYPDNFFDSDLKFIQGDFAKIIPLLDKARKENDLKSDYQITGLFNKADFIKLIVEEFPNNSLISLNGYMHAVGFVKNDNKFYYIRPLQDFGATIDPDIVWENMMKEFCFIVCSNEQHSSLNSEGKRRIFFDTLNTFKNGILLNIKIQSFDSFKLSPKNLVAEYSQKVGQHAFNSIVTLPLLAIQSNDPDALDYHADSLTHEILNQKHHRYSSLMVAITQSCLVIAAKLLKMGANPDFIDIETKITPLIFAVNENNIDAVKLLLQYGANVNYERQVNNININVIHYAKNEEMRTLLLQYITASKLTELQQESVLKISHSSPTLTPSPSLLGNSNQFLEILSSPSILVENTPMKQENSQLIEENEKNTMMNDFAVSCINAQINNKNIPFDGADLIAWDSWDDQIQYHPITKLPIFIYRAFNSNNNEIGSAEFYGTPLLCRASDGVSHNILHRTGIFAELDIAETLNICIDLPPTFIEEHLTSAAYAGSYGALLGLKDVIETICAAHNTQIPLLKYAPELVHYSLYYASTLLAYYYFQSENSEDESWEKIISLGSQAALDTLTLAATHLTLTQVDNMIKKLSNKAQTNGWTNTGKTLNWLGKYSGAPIFTLINWNNGMGVSHGITNTAAGVAARKIVAKCGNSLYSLFSHQKTNTSMESSQGENNKPKSKIN
ncbi:MAG: hypothetical protein HKM04_05910 [Legionellales bacterium]|nr:hypothetical protein [Legionellales bacterium]